MLPIPEDMDLSILRECKVSEVCYAQDGITVHFGLNAYITINGYFAFRHGKQRHEYYKITPVENDYGLLKLLGAEVREVYMSNNRDSMTIEFADDNRLELMGHMIEDSYTIHILDKEAIV